MTASPASIDAHVRYYELRLAECRRRIELHARQAAVVDAILSRARGAADPAELDRRLAADGLRDALAVAWVVDHYAARARLYDALGATARAAAVRGVVAAAGDDLTRPLRSLDRAVMAAELAHARAAAAGGAVTRWAQAVHTAWTARDTGERMVGRLVVDFAWRQARDGDAALEPSLAGARVRSYAPYRERFALDDLGVAAIETWRVTLAAEPSWGLALPPAGPLPPMPEAPLTEAAPAPTEDPVPALADALAADQPLALARATARRSADELAARAPDLAQPHVGPLRDALARDLAAATTAAEAWLAGEHFRERLEVEGDALTLVAQIALRPLELALDETEPADAIAAALAASDAALGAPWPTLLRTGWLRAQLDAAARIASDRARPLPAGLLGEVGVGLAATFRAAIENPRSAAGRALAAAPHDPGALVAAVAVRHKPIAEARAAMADLEAALCRPRTQILAVLPPAPA